MLDKAVGVANAVRILVLAAISEHPYTTITPGEVGTLVDADEFRHVIRWDRLHPGLEPWGNVTFIATDDVDTMAKVTYFGVEHGVFVPHVRG
jgi:hypothetical protein